MTQIDWETSFLQVDPCLQKRPSYMGNHRDESIPDSMSRHDVTNPSDKLELVNYS